MKKLFFLVSCFFFLCTSLVWAQTGSTAGTGSAKQEYTGDVTGTASLETIVKRMARQGITQATTLDTYKPNAGLTRQETAKMTVQFILSYELQRNANPASCGFEDIYASSKVFVPYIMSACSMNLMRGTNKKFFPTAQLSRAEALAILLRMFKKELRTSAKPWYKNYYTFGVAYGIVDGDIADMEKLITRGEFARMLYAVHMYFQK